MFAKSRIAILTVVVLVAFVAAIASMQLHGPSPSLALTDGQADLTVEFPGITGAVVQVFTDDGVAGTVGSFIDGVGPQNDSASLSVPHGTYDVKVIKSSEHKVIDSVDCTGSTCVVNDIISTLTVEFPGISGVTVQVFTPASSFVDGVAAQTDSASLTVLKDTYDVKVIKLSENKVIESVDCTDPTCEVVDIVSTLTVEFPGVVGVVVQVFTPAGSFVDGVAPQNDSGTLTVLKDTYDVKVIKGSDSKIIDSVNCGSFAQVEFTFVGNPYTLTCGFIFGDTFEERTTGTLSPDYAVLSGDVQVVSTTQKDGTIQVDPIIRTAVRLK